jgi:hypothetical protein
MRNVAKVCSQAARNGDGRGCRSHRGATRGLAVCSELVLAWLGSVGVARAEESVAESAPTEAPAVAPTPEAIPFDPNIVPALAVRRWQT